MEQINISSKYSQNRIEISQEKYVLLKGAKFSFSILSKVEALALKAVLIPGSQAYNELQRSLIFKQGITTLSNGIKINTNPSYEKLLGGMKNEELEFGEIHQIFEEVISNIGQLRNKPKTEQVVILSRVIKDIDILIDYTAAISKCIEDKQKTVQEHLLHTLAKQNQAYEMLRQKQSECSYLEAQLDGLQKAQEQVGESIEQLQVDFESINTAIQQEKAQRFEAAIDWVPFVGIIEGLRTKKYARIIPFYSFINGIISTVEQKQECLENESRLVDNEKKKLTEEKQRIFEEINRKNKEIGQLKGLVNRLNQEIDLKDQEIKLLGGNLTEVKNIHFSLKEIMVKYRFLQLDVDTVRDTIELDLFEFDEIQFIQNIKAIQGTFNEGLLEFG